MKEITCCFTGHRKIPNDEIKNIQEKTKNLILQLISDGYHHFCTGGALGFDTIAAKSVLDIRNRFPFVRLTLYLPHYSQADHWNQSDKIIYKKIKNCADEVIYTSELYYKGCMHKRNRILVENSSACICYKTRETGGTAYTVKYAQEKGLKIYYV